MYEVGAMLLDKNRSHKDVTQRTGGKVCRQQRSTKTAITNNCMVGVSILEWTGHGEG
jgi:hypothetical protein